MTGFRGSKRQRLLKQSRQVEFHQKKAMKTSRVRSRTPDVMQTIATNNPQFLLF
jgi:hypothetical protein